MVTLRQIQFALAVARHRHFKRAAEECNISQSALSLGIAELEKILGVTIFERNNKQVVITPIGQELLERARKIYLDAQQLIERAKTGESDFGFSMTIGFIPTIAPFLLPVVLPDIRIRYPYFSLNIVEDRTTQLLQNLRAGVLDMAIIALPFDVSGFITFEFATETFFVLAHKNNPLCQKNTHSLGLRQLNKQNLLLLGEGHCLHDHVLNICHLHDDKHRKHFSDASLNTLIQLVNNDMGITFIPQIAIPQMTHYPDLRLRTLDTPGPHRQLVIATRPNYPRHRELGILRDIFAKSCQTLLASATTLLP